MAEVLGLTSSIIAIIQITTKITQLAYQYTTDVRGAPESIKMFLEEIQSLAYILDVLNEFRKKNPHLSVIQKLERPLNEFLVEMNMLATKFEPKIKPSWWRRTITKLKWPLNDGEISEFLNRVERFKSTVMIVIGTANLFIEAKPPAGERRKLILHWLYPHAFDQKHTEVVKRSQGDIGWWMQETPEFRNWIASDTDPRTLWVYGAAGAGKTFMTSFMIDHFLSLQISQEVCGVAYIYFDYKDPDLQKPTSILASLGKQLASQTQQVLPQELGYIYDELSYQQRRPSTEQLYQILLRLTRLFDRTFIVCDSFDEYQGQRKELLSLFRRMEGGGIRLLLTSREDCNDVKDFSQNSAKVRFCATSEVIANYIGRRITNLNIPEQDKHQIVSELTDCAERIFLLAFSNTKYLREQIERKGDLGQLRILKGSATHNSSPTHNHMKHLFALLEQLKILKYSAPNPSNPLENTYNFYMTAFHAQRRESVDLGLIVLLWLVKTRRTLKVLELQLAVSMHTRKRKSKTPYETDLPDREMILDVCANFILFDEKDDTIKLIHYTVQEFLLKNPILPSDADSKVALACISYLSLGIFAQGPCTTNSTLETRRKQHPFHKYASDNLSYHLRSCNEASTENAVLNFLKEPGCVKSYLQALHCKAPPPSTGEEPEHHDQYPKHQTSLHVAATLGHLAVTQKLLQKKSTKINALDDYGKTPMMIAAMEGHQRIVKQLLQNGADPSIPDRNGITPLHVSISQGHGAGSIFWLLLDRGANLSAADHRGCTPLHWAASQGLEPETRTLIDKGADVMNGDSEGRRALHAAALYGHEQVVRLLLEKGAEISVADDSGGTPLHMAAECGHWDLIELLLDKGADIAAVTHEGNTALHSAASGGEGKAVAKLLKRGIEISVINNRGCTPLHLAASSGHQKVAQSLLELGANISSADMKGWTALHYAAKNGHEPLVRTLLEWGANPSSIDKEGITVLHRAVSYKPIVEILLRKGANITRVDSRGRTVLHWACRLGVLDVVDLLLESNADHSHVDDEGRTALHYAAFAGHKPIVGLLIEVGADLSVVDNRGQTAYQVAVAENHASIIQLLKA